MIQNYRVVKILLAILVVGVLTTYQSRALVESYYLKYFYDVAIEETIPNEKNLQISYYAKKQISVTNSYDGSYVELTYPKGDVDLSTGVCTDVVVRALRGINMDLQQLIHEDIVYNKTQYGVINPDNNIDHRRVPNIQTYFTRAGYSLPISKDENNYEPGDIVTWKFMNWNHIGIVSNIKKEGTNRYYIVHNGYKGTELSDWLFFSEITGHYRVNFI